MTQNFAIFDFDHTLITQSSLKLLLFSLCGKPAVISAAIAAGTCALLPAESPGREIFRAGLLKRLIKGHTQADITQAANHIASRLKWNDTVLERYHWHKNQGHRILIATGGLACYMPVLLAAGGISYDGLLASEMVMRDGRFTGKMAGPACTWGEKARRVQNWLESQGLSAHAEGSWGYGNPPNDDAMLALTRHQTTVSG